MPLRTLTLGSIYHLKKKTTKFVHLCFFFTVWFYIYCLHHWLAYFSSLKMYAKCYFHNAICLPVFFVIISWQHCWKRNSRRRGDWKQFFFFPIEMINCTCVVFCGRVLNFECFFLSPHSLLGGIRMTEEVRKLNWIFLNLFYSLITCVKSPNLNSNI